MWPAVAVRKQVGFGAAVHLAFDHLKSYVESAGVIMLPGCNRGLGRWLERHGAAEGEVARGIGQAPLVAAVHPPRHHVASRADSLAGAGPRQHMHRPARRGDALDSPAR
jgi:hypothetical protein